GFGERLDIAYDRAAALHLLGDAAHLFFESQNDLAGFGRGAGAALGEVSDFVGDDGEAAAAFAGAGGFDGGVQCQEIRLLGDVADERDAIGDAPSGLGQFIAGGRASAYEPLRIGEPLDGAGNRAAVLARD